MRHWPIPALLLLTLAAAVAPAHAQVPPPVFRCVGVHGEPVFSGQPCGNPGSGTAAGVVTEGSGFGAECAVSPLALRDAIAGAFLTHDVNRLAGLLLWRGISQATARATLPALARWLQQPLAGIAIAYATGSPPAAGDPAVAASTSAVPASAASTALPIGFEVSTGGGDGSSRSFGVAESEGCWWLTF